MKIKVITLRKQQSGIVLLAAVVLSLLLFTIMWIGSGTGHSNAVLQQKVSTSTTSKNTSFNYSECASINAKTQKAWINQAVLTGSDIVNTIDCDPSPTDINPTVTISAKRDLSIGNSHLHKVIVTIKTETDITDTTTSTVTSGITRQVPSLAL